MGRRYPATDVREAIRIAESFRAQGAYDWFRGQRADWPLKSSFARLRSHEEDSALERAERFIAWAQETPGLEELVKDVDATCAVGQHYGIATNYIDFTTSPEVAGFFATDNPSGRTASGNGCILCLNTSDLKAFWKRLPADWPAPEFIEVKVPSLWRLAAQDGWFLFCGAENFEDIYDLDRIIFPHSEIDSILPRERVYPTSKSGLEVLLDQFFMGERLAAGTQRVDQMPWKRIRFKSPGDWNPELATVEV
jgi:hypothetical protein